MPEDKDTPQQETDDKGPDTGEPDYKDEVAKWRAMSRKHEAQAKTNSDAAKRLAELEDANKSETQKLADKVSAAEKRTADAEAKATRYEVASELGVQAKHLKYLSGTTREDIEASAKGILDDFPEVYAKSDTDDARPTRPKERLRAGAASDADPDPVHAINDRIRAAARR